MSEPSILKSADVANALGLSPTALREWYGADATLAGCILRRTKRSTWWSVQRLRDRGFLTKPATNATAPQAQAVAS